MKDINYEIIEAGKGIHNIIIGHSNFYDVINFYDDKYKLVFHNNYSAEVVYLEKGLSFYYLLCDEKKEIFSITIKQPVLCKTSTGIVLGISTMENVKEKYDTLYWCTTRRKDNNTFSGNTWCSEHDGLSFYVEKDKSYPEFPLNEGVHIKKTIIGISIDKKLSDEEYKEHIYWWEYI